MGEVIKLFEPKPLTREERIALIVRFQAINDRLELLGSEAEILDRERESIRERLEQDRSGV